MLRLSRPRWSTPLAAVRTGASPRCHHQDSRGAQPSTAGCPPAPNSAHQQHAGLPWLPASARGCHAPWRGMRGVLHGLAYRTRIRAAACAAVGQLQWRETAPNAPQMPPHRPHPVAIRRSAARSRATRGCCSRNDVRRKSKHQDVSSQLAPGEVDVIHGAVGNKIGAVCCADRQLGLLTQVLRRAMHPQKPSRPTVTS